MVTQQELCKRIESIHPDIGVCGVDFDVEFDEENNAWEVDLHHGSHHLKTLKKCGIVKSRDEGKKSMYSISNHQLSELISNVTKASKKIPVLCNDKTCC